MCFWRPYVFFLLGGGNTMAYIFFVFDDFDAHGLKQTYLNFLKVLFFPSWVSTFSFCLAMCRLKPT